MKHFFGFISAVVLVLLLLYFYKDDGLNKNDNSSLKVYGSESFIGSWGPGPLIKELFEKQYGIKVTYIEMNDPLLLLQKMSFDSGSRPILNAFEEWFNKIALYSNEYKLKLLLGIGSVLKENQLIVASASEQLRLLEQLKQTKK